MSSPQRRQRRDRDRMSLVLWAAALWVVASLFFASKLSALKQGSRKNRSSEESVSVAKNRRHLGADISGDVPTLAPRRASPPLNLSALFVASGLTDPKISGLGPALSPAERYGGWKFDSAVFDAALGWPGATALSLHSPRLLFIENFLFPEEVAHLVALAESGFERSETVSDGLTVTKARTSYGAWLNGPRRTPTVLNVQHRIEELTGIPESFGESLYVLRYEEGQKYEVHTDHCARGGEELTESCRTFLGRAGGPGCGAGAGGVTCGDRLATLVIYLQSPEEGGATVFPSAPRPRAGSGGSGESRGDEDALPPLLNIANGGAEVPWYCKEDAQVLRASPRSGDALLFFDYVPGSDGGDGSAVADPSSAHAGCPPLKGTKMIVTRWMRSADFS